MSMCASLHTITLISNKRSILPEGTFASGHTHIVCFGVNKFAHIFLIVTEDAKVTVVSTSLEP
jgi:hypothetical protein